MASRSTKSRGGVQHETAKLCRVERGINRMSYQEEQIADIAGKFRSGRITRREFLHHVSMLGGFTIAAGAIPGILASCAPTQAPTPAVSGGAPKRGGTLVAATIDKPVNMDPAFAPLYSSIQVYHTVF